MESRRTLKSQPTLTSHVPTCSTTDCCGAYMAQIAEPPRFVLRGPAAMAAHTPSSAWLTADSCFLPSAETEHGLVTETGNYQWPRRGPDVRR
jgi:hypothetical protein